MLSAVLVQCSVSGAISILDSTCHLGVPGEPEWSPFEGKAPKGSELTLRFDSSSDGTEKTLFIRQEDVKQDWVVTLNGRSLGNLF